MNLNRRIAYLILTRESKGFNADDVTDCGNLTIDGEHKQNGPQGAIGNAFRQLARDGIIVNYGEAEKSRSKHRKSGRILRWYGNGDIGKAWARDVFSDGR